MTYRVSREDKASGGIRLSVCVSTLSVFEETYFSFFLDFQNMTFYGFFGNGVSKSRKKSLAKVYLVLTPSK